MKGDNPYEQSDFLARELSNVAREPYTVNALLSIGGSPTPSIQLSLTSSQALSEFTVSQNDVLQNWEPCLKGLPDTTFLQDT
jgi:hypothetical protein